MHQHQPLNHCQNHENKSHSWPDLSKNFTNKLVIGLTPVTQILVVFWAFLKAILDYLNHKKSQDCLVVVGWTPVKNHKIVSSRPDLLNVSTMTTSGRVKFSWLP